MEDGEPAVACVAHGSPGIGDRVQFRRWSASPSSMICSASREREIRSAQVLAHQARSPEFAKHQTLSRCGHVGEAGLVCPAQQQPARVGFAPLCRATARYSSSHRSSRSSPGDQIIAS